MGALFPEEIKAEIKDEKITTLKITDIEPNRNQPRKDFDKEKINALSLSISEHGLIQPIVVMKNKSGRYTIVAGERRWRASKQAGLKEVPVVVNEYTDEEAAEITLIENLQREDLNPIEEAIGYRALLNDYNMTQEEISKKIGKSRSSIANSIRLLSLDKEFAELLSKGELTSGHARAILSLEEKEKRAVLCEKIINDGLNVRQAEKMAKQLQGISLPKNNKKKKKTAYDLQIEEITEKLSSKLGTKVAFKRGTKKSKIEIEYYNDSDLNRILEMLMI